MKYVALLKVFNSTLASTWHSGSATSYYGMPGFDSSEEAQSWIEEKKESYSRYNNNEYYFTPCILSYDEAQSQNVEAFFRHMH